MNKEALSLSLDGGTAAATPGRKTSQENCRKGPRAGLTYGIWHPPKAYTSHHEAPPCLREFEWGFLQLTTEGILKDAYLRTTAFWMQNGPRESHSPVVSKLFQTMETFLSQKESFGGGEVPMQKTAKEAMLSG